MLTLKDAAEALGVSQRGIRLRLDALRPEIAALLRKGRNGQVVLTDSAWAMLQRLEAVRRADGLTVALAAERVRRELAERVTGGGQAESTQGNGDHGGEVAVLRELVEELRRDRDHWRDLALQLQDRILALPGPRERRPRPWWSFPPFKFLWT